VPEGGAATATGARRDGGFGSALSSPLTPLAIAFLAAPMAVVLQAQAVAPIATAALIAMVVMHLRRRRRLPWPHGVTAWVAMAMMLWGCISATWALEPDRAIFTGLQIMGFIALGAAGTAVAAHARESDKRRFALVAAFGIVLGLVVAGIDAATGNALRATVRGLDAAPPGLSFGLKPAGSALALWLPLLAGAILLPVWLRAGLIILGGAVLLALPGDSARIALVAAGAIGLLALPLPEEWRRQLPRLVGAALALAILATPALVGPVLRQGFPADELPASAAHRMLVWNFTAERIEEAPLAGWGLESSRQIPGAKGPPSEKLLARFFLEGPDVAPWIRTSELLPLHPHNASLQLWLELGILGAMMGALLAMLIGREAGKTEWPGVGAAMLTCFGVTAMLSFGVWQEWWIGAQLLALAAVAALPSPAWRR
jgi:O-antigen ligase